MFSHTNRATARVLQENGCEVIIPNTQGCCGAIHYHSGNAQPAMDFATANADAFSDDSLDAIIVNVAGCGSMLKDYGHIADELSAENKDDLKQFAGKVRDVSEFLDELGLIPPSGPIPLRAAIHDACHLQHAQQVRSQPRRILSAIPELELLEPGESELCCGAAGSYSLTQPDMADRLGSRKVQQLTATDPQIIVTGNAGCSLQIQSHLRRNDNRSASTAKIPVFHPMDLLDMSYQGIAPAL